MSAMSPAAAAGSQQAAIEAALVLLERMGLSPADLVAAPRDRATVPTFAEYVPVVSAAVSAGTRRAYGSYWNRIVEHWGGRRLVQHGHDRHAPPGGQLLRYADRRSITWRRYDHLWVRIGRHLPWVRTQQISIHWIRHTTLTS